MAAKTKSQPRPPVPDLEPLTEMLRTPPTTKEERLVHIRALGQRVKEYIRFMCAVGRMAGSSAEVKEKAVTAFYERLALMEQDLGRIQEQLQLE